LLWVGHSVSILGDYIFFIAISFWVYARTGSSLTVGAVLVSSTLPLMLCAPLAGRVVDRYERRRMMLLAESGRGLLFLATLVVILWRPGALWPIYAVGFAQSALAAFFWPARSAMLPQLAPGEALASANALFQFSDGVVRVVAPTLAALALLRLGAAGVVALDAATFVVSAGCVALMIRMPPVVAPSSLAVAASRSATHHGADSQPSHGGLRQLRLAHTGKPQPRSTPFGEQWALVVVGASIALVGSALGVALPIYVRASLHAGPLAYGWLFTAQALGEIAASALLGLRGRATLRPHAPARSSRRRLTRYAIGYAIAASLISAASALAMLSIMRALGPALAASVIFGALTAFASVQLLTLLQRSAPSHQLGRRLARYAAAQASAQLAGLTLTSALATHIAVGRLIALDGALPLACGAVVWALLVWMRMFHVKHHSTRA
jgi:DHA3 family tetracycline resistance protein-like MFS transporter